VTAPVLEERRPAAGHLVAFLALLTAVAWTLAAFSAFPWTGSPPGAAVLKVAFKHVAPLEREARQLSREELERLPRHMRPAAGTATATGRRRSLALRVTLDGTVLLERTYQPGGLRGDGPTFAYEELALPTGSHQLTATVTVAGDHDGSDDAETDDDEEEDDRHGWRLDRVVDVPPGRVLLLELAEDGGLTLR
jgi:hypothetical protein